MQELLFLQPQMRILFTFFVVVGILVSGCKVKPEACYTIDKPRQDIHAKVNIQFTSCSDNAETLRWTFGDGTEAEGIQVTHMFTLPGQYQVVLTAVNGERSDQVTEVITVLP